MAVRTPVRIYVLWHAAYEDGYKLARHIYHWFRMSTGEGIPVYFRCWKGNEDDNPPIKDDDCDLNIVVPLVEPNMVASLNWRRYVEDLVIKLERTQEADEQRSKLGHARYKILPIALDVTAYQMPSRVNRLNFIRHLDDKSKVDYEIMLTKLTEAVGLILRETVGLQTRKTVRLKSRKTVVQAETKPIKIFLSHAKADGTEIPKEIKHYIQTETQCHTFFDENDINYGHDFSNEIKEALETESAGLLVVQGDHYADRPWCRKEIRDFLKPHRIETVDKKGGILYSIMPAVVVINFAGNKSARTIPELGHASCLQWTQDAARRAVVTLLREILFSSFYRLLAQAAQREIKAENGKTNLLVNRPPDPVMVEHICRDAKIPYKSRKGVVIHHPGHGLTGVEKKGLEAIYTMSFKAFGANYDAELCEDMANVENCFSGEVLAVSVSESSDILNAGISDDHTVELLRAILRPAFKQGISLLYGGALPTWGESKEEAWETRVNFTETFLDYLLAERNSERGKIASVSDQSTKSLVSAPAPRLFNLSAWPYSTKFGIEEEAQWINTCSFIRVNQKEAGITKPIETPVFQDKYITPEQRLNTALCLSAMRKKACGRIHCDTPDSENFEFTPLGHIFIGGQMKGFSGVIPGVWEEILLAFESQRPAFIIGACRGAAGMIAQWLNEPPEQKPEELSFNYFVQNSENPEIMLQLGNDIEKAAPYLAPDRQLNRLWEYIDCQKKRELPGNGLTPEENKRLWTSQNFRVIAELTGKGLCELKNIKDTVN